MPLLLQLCSAAAGGCLDNLVSTAAVIAAASCCRRPPVSRSACAGSHKHPMTLEVVLIPMVCQSGLDQSGLNMLLPNHAPTYAQ